MKIIIVTLDVVTYLCLMLVRWSSPKKLKNKPELTITNLMLCKFIVNSYEPWLYVFSLILDGWDYMKSNIRYTRYELRNMQNTSSNTANVNSLQLPYKIYISTFSALRSLYNSTRYWLLGLLFMLVIIYHLAYIRCISHNKFIFEVTLLFMFTYWLMSGFVFFVKKSQYSKFTTALQRFWKRSFMIFWLLEIFIFLVFLYLTINATEEPVYMYDQIKIYKTHLFSWRWFLAKLIPYMFIFLLTSHCLLSFKWGVFAKQTNNLFLITLVLIYIVWLEFYQFFHILNWYGNIFWVYDYEDFLWNIEIELRRTRLANNYIALCLMAKFWHLIFIFIFWIFFIIRLNELGRLRFIFLNSNLQNFLILYIMTWLYMYPWFKYILRKYIDYPYYWLFTNFREIGLKVFIYDLFALLRSLLTTISFNNAIGFKNYGTFYYWSCVLLNKGTASFNKHVFYYLV